ncbi:MAG TPA: DUF58 domain-containing protein [Verrucomicrobiae bacterium]|nr:DUF58 domain-containing protein [Verrucomicrobiae bacterium]
MIVPRSRLLFWVAIVVMPFSLLGAVLPTGTLLSVLVIASLVFLVVLDAALAYNGLQGIHVKLPDVVRLTKDVENAIDLQIENDRGDSLELRLGLAFPREIASPHEDLLARVRAGTRFSRISWPCTPLQRGIYNLDACYLERASSFGFWSVRTAVPAHAEIRVYPNLLSERKNLAAVFLRRGNFGIHAQRQIGQGRDFEMLRDYIPGDGMEEIHWKATAKRGRPVTKLFQIERTQEVYVIVDASRLSARTAMPTNSVVLERFITAALVLGLVAEQQGDLFGISSFGDRVQNFIRASGGKEHYGACRDALFTLQPQMVTPDFDGLCTFIRLRLRRRALLVILTSLDDPILAENFARNVELICHQHLVLVGMLRPPTARPIFADGRVTSADDVYQALGGHILWHDLRELERSLQRRGVQFSQLDDERMAVQLVSQYIDIKRRQLL